MKRFILLGCIGMVLALACVVVVWAYLQGFFWRQQSVETTPPTVIQSTDEPAAPTQPTATESSVGADALEAAPSEPGGLPATALSLTDEQAEAVADLGLDVEQIVISEALIGCVRERLGESRYQAVLAGDTPTLVETGKLLPCLGR
jgi:hypothetical protein